MAEGGADATLSAWLPRTHEAYLERFGDAVVDLGASLDGVRTGLVVAKVAVGRQTDAIGEQVEPYIPVTSINQLNQYADEFNGRIVGIEQDAGVMQRTRAPLRSYGLQDAFRLVEGSETTMFDSLERTIRNQRWIVVTGWTPHWAFGQWNLAFLEDPRNIYGGQERIHTVTFKGFAQEHPGLVAVLDRFHWDLEHIEQVMLWMEREDGIDPYATALRWVESHPGVVDDWVSGPPE